MDSRFWNQAFLSDFSVQAFAGSKATSIHEGAEVQSLQMSKPYQTVML